MSQPVDLSLLESMFGDDAELRSAILQEFVKSADAYVDELEGALSSRQSDGLKSLAHKLKSSARTIGAEPLASICEVIERSAPNKDWSLLEGLAAELRQSLMCVLVFILALPTTS